MSGVRVVAIIFFIVIISFGYIYFSSNVHLTSTNYTRGIVIKTSNPKSNHRYRKLSFNKDKGDVFSFIHIQKTGGTTIEKHLVHNIKDSNCHCGKSRKPSCMCYRNDIKEIWLVCRYIQPKWPCGLHPDYATLKDCTPQFIDNLYEPRKRRYFYGTVLRNPLHRFLSEFRHMQRGASWEAAASLCRGELLMNQIPSCFENGKIWNNLTIEKFISCPYNLAVNRQTWMLSNISKISCNFKSIMLNNRKRNALLNIAKQNINSISYFGLLEYPLESQFIFEKTFNMKFIEPFQQWDTGFAVEYLKIIPQSDDIIEKIVKINSLDFALYKYAKRIFFERYKFFTTKYGPPVKIQPRVDVKRNRFSMGKGKLERLKSNLPRSKHKEKLLKKKKDRENRKKSQ